MGRGRCCVSGARYSSDGAYEPFSFSATSVPGASLLIWSDSPPVIEVTATWLSATIISDHWNRRIYTLQTYADALSTSGSSLTVDRPRMLRAIHDAIGNDHAFARRLMHTLCVTTDIDGDEDLIFAQH